MDHVLKLLNANTESPYLIWNAQTRTELLEYVEQWKHSTVTTVSGWSLLMTTGT